MAKMTIREADSDWTVRAGGAVLGETNAALELREEGHDPVIYFPREDIAMAFLDASDHTSHCPHKGDATYFSIITKSRTLANAVWSYEAPKDGAEALRGHLAFHVGDDVKVERS